MSSGINFQSGGQKPFVMTGSESPAELAGALKGNTQKLLIHYNSLIGGFNPEISKPLIERRVSIWEESTEEEGSFFDGTTEPFDPTDEVSVSTYSDYEGDDDDDDVSFEEERKEDHASGGSSSESTTRGAFELPTVAIDPEIFEVEPRRVSVAQRAWKGFKRALKRKKDKVTLGTFAQTQAYMSSLETPIRQNQLVDASTNRAFRRLVKKSLPVGGARSEILEILRNARQEKKHGNGDRAFTLTLQAMAAFERQNIRWNVPEMSEEDMSALSFFEQRTLKCRSSKMEATNQIKRMLGTEQKKIVSTMLKELHENDLFSKHAFDLYQALLRNCGLNPTLYQQQVANLELTKDAMKGDVPNIDGAKYYLGMIMDTVQFSVGTTAEVKTMLPQWKIDNGIF